MTRLMSHDCVGRSFELSYSIGEIGEGHVTVYYETTSVWNAKKDWYAVSRLIRNKA